MIQQQQVALPLNLQWHRMTAHDLRQLAKDQCFGNISLMTHVIVNEMDKKYIWDPGQKSPWKS